MEDIKEGATTLFTFLLTLSILILIGVIVFT